MYYAKVFINPRPWTNERTLIGLIAENPATGLLEAVHASFSVEAARSASASKPEDLVKKQKTVELFFGSLERLIAHMPEASIARILAQIPDRGTSIQFSPELYGDFSSMSEVLSHCLQEEVDPVEETDPSAIGSHRQVRKVAFQTLGGILHPSH